VFSTGLFYFGWIVCLQEASTGHFFYGLLMVFAIVAYYLYHSSCRKADYLLLTLVIFIGPLSDILYSQLGLLHYHSPFYLFSWLPPLWVFLLWGLFGANIHLFSWLSKRWWLCILLGALGGPMSYLSVLKLGGASLLKPLPLAFIAIGGIWAIFFPSFIWLNDFLKKRFRDSP
jgi:hypothetical protein